MGKGISKHQKIINYIKDLEVDSKISVRGISQKLSVSEGTAYRAIKEAEKQGLVNTVPRVGTIRIEKVEKKNFEQLTFGEVANIVDGSILSGRAGLQKTLNKFVIGAMTVDAMSNYLSKGDLLIVGNREEAFSLAIERDSAILITGGFHCSEETKRLADEKNLPIISSTYDSFTVATMINKAIYERLIKKEILLVEDILTEDPYSMSKDQTVAQYKSLVEDTGIERFPVLDKDGYLVGIITPKDIVTSKDDQYISDIMSKNPFFVSPKTSVAYAAHYMIWEGVEVLPVLENRVFKGVITRRDVMKAIHQMRNQPQMVETLEDQLIDNFELINIKDGIRYRGRVTPYMLSQLGIASWSSLNMLMTIVGTEAIIKSKNVDMIMDNFTSYFIRPIQIDFVIDVHGKIIDLGRNFCKVEIEILYKDTIIAKSMMSARIMKK